MIETKYRRYYIYGYINNRNISRTFGNVHKDESFVNQKIKETFRYLGMKSPDGDYSKWKEVISFVETVLSLLLVTWHFLVVSVKKVFKKKISLQGCNLIAPLSAAQYRVKDMLRSLDGVEVTTVSIPFIDNSYHNNEVDILSVISYADICEAYSSALGMIFFMKRKYGKDDILFRSYSSFEYFMACQFVKRVENSNNIIYYSTYDRWGFLFCGANTTVTFIQHGKLDYITKLIRVGTPTVAYYISPGQKKVLEDTLFVSEPQTTRYRKMLQFTHNEILNHENGKKNILIVSYSKVTDAVAQIVKMLVEDTNIYVKPHPGEMKLDVYDQLERDYGITLLEKTDYPEADVVLSYNSTLADEYEMAGVRVIRWDLLKKLSDVRELVLEQKNN
jgi:hypothetical protein